MDTRFVGWEDKQCATCLLCKNTQAGMKCDIFTLPYYVWGKYYAWGAYVWKKRVREKRSPTKCWAYCGSAAELKARDFAMESYSKRKNCG